MKYMTVVLLYLLFSLASALAGLWGLVFFRRIGQVTQAMDRTLAAMLGWDGRSTVSKECDSSDCRFCRVLCRVLNWAFKQHHCGKAAE